MKESRCYNDESILKNWEYYRKAHYINMGFPSLECLRNDSLCVICHKDHCFECLVWRPKIRKEK